MMRALALLLAMQTAPQPPAALVQPLTIARNAMATVDNCRERFAALDRNPAADSLDERYLNAEARLRRIWTVPPLQGTPFSSGCSRDTIRSQLRRAGQALDMFDSAFRGALGPMAHGAWLGTIKICSAHVTDATVTALQDTGQPALRLAFAPGAAARLYAITQAALHFQIAVLIDGEEVMASRVDEPMRSPVLLAVSDDATRTALRDAARSPC